MLFNSIEFVPFLLLVLLAYHLVVPPRFVRTRKCVLIASSYLFYVSWNPYFGLLLAFSTGLDYLLALRMGVVQQRRTRVFLLMLSLFGNLGLLGFFKYGSFVLQNVEPLLGATASEGDFWFLELTVPVGISFYTFQTMSYSIDVFRGVQRPTRSLLDFALYVSFFPQLVAGPIVRAGTLLPQFERPTTPRAADVEYGLMRIAVGLGKKVVFADMLGTYADFIFASPGAHAGGEILLAVYAYAYQIYFDFSGYSDIAIGLARLFGVRIPENFNRPYLAASVREFWQRWHMSLSTWLRDYLYFSLGGNRRGTGRTATNLLITMVLGGLWHGASWNFLVWGTYHGLLLVVHRGMLHYRKPEASRVPIVVRRLVTFHLVCFGWLLFRLPTLSDVSLAVSQFGVLGFDASRSAIQAISLLVVAIGLGLGTTSAGLRARILEFPGWAQGLAYALLALAIYLVSGSGQRFIYFQF